MLIINKKKRNKEIKSMLTDTLAVTWVPGGLPSRTDAVYAGCPNSGLYSFKFTTVTVTVAVTAA